MMLNAAHFAAAPAAETVSSPLRVRNDPYQNHFCRAVVTDNIHKVRAAILPNAAATLAIQAAPGKGKGDGGKTDVGALGAKKMSVFMSSEGQPVGFFNLEALEDAGAAKRDIPVPHGADSMRLFFGQVGHETDEVGLLGLIALLAPSAVVLSIEQQRRKGSPERKTGAAFVEVVAGTEAEVLALSRRVRFVSGGVLVFTDATSLTAIEQERMATYHLGMKQFADGNAVHRMVVEPRDRHNGGSGAREPMAPVATVMGLPRMIDNSRQAVGRKSAANLAPWSAASPSYAFLAY